MTRARHNYELLYDAHICVTYLKWNDINTKINMKATSQNGVNAVLLHYKKGVFKVNKRINL
jgi:hypothetical protein